MKKYLIVLGLLSIVLVGCTAQTKPEPVVEIPVEVEPSVASFDALGTSIAWTQEANGFGLIAPDGSASVFIAQNFSGAQDIVLRVDATPFIAAGLDVTKLSETSFVDGLLTYSVDLDGSKTYANVVEAFTDIVSIQADLVGYHAALDHYGLSLNDGNVFEWAADVKTNDKDIVFVLNPQSLMDAGVDVENIEGWIFAEVEIMLADGTMKMVPKLLKPFDLN